MRNATSRTWNANCPFLWQSVRDGARYCMDVKDVNVRCVVNNIHTSYISDKYTAYATNRPWIVLSCIIIKIALSGNLNNYRKLPFKYVNNNGISEVVEISTTKS